MDYVDRVYAGVLGKIIGVYLGRPFEGWPYQRIMAELGEIWYYVHEQLGTPLVVTDDDISGTFTFLRALPDHSNTHDLTPEQIGETWLNYIIEDRTILWWGGMATSTEHTAYLRLKNGIPAPRSGSIELNGHTVAEQIGAQIFIDGWAMVAPGDPAFAADLARRAASVSHDGEAVYGAQVIAAIESAAFIESDMNKLLDTAVGFIPHDSLIYRLIADIRNWHTGHPHDWRRTRQQIENQYGYDRYGGGCHMIPNHALIVMALLHGDDDFQKSLMIANTSGWDTDCNSGNVGCILGIKNGLAGIDAGPDWRGPVADRLYLPTADGGRAITDAVTETYHIVNIGRALAGEAPLQAGANFHFSLPGSVQGFRAEDSPECRNVIRVSNADGRLALTYTGLAPGRFGRAATATWIEPEQMNMPGYGLIASPTLYSGQKLRTSVSADRHNHRSVIARLYLDVYRGDGTLRKLYGPEHALLPGSSHELEWTIPDTAYAPVARVGLELTAAERSHGTVYVEWLDWSGTPKLTFAPMPDGGDVGHRTWINGVDRLDTQTENMFRLIQNSGRGLLSTGSRDWTDYTVQASVYVHMAAAAGIAARVQGMRRYYGLLLCPDGKVCLTRGTDVLDEADFDWTYGGTYDLKLEVYGSALRGSVNGTPLVQAEDEAYTGGGIALVCEEGRIHTDSVHISP